LATVLFSADLPPFKAAAPAGGVLMRGVQGRQPKNSKKGVALPMIRMVCTF
jgi:hypothetical protein